MPITTYPTGAALTTFLSASGLTTTSLDVDTAVLAGIADFERATGRKFYSATRTARTFDPPTDMRAMLDLKWDLASDDAVAAVVVSYGVTKTANTDYRFQPRDAAGDGVPYNRLELRGRWLFPHDWDDNDAISITGTWAYSAIGIAPDAYRAMLAASALDLLPQIAYAFTKGLVTWSEAGVSESYGQDPFSGLRQVWMELVSKSTLRHRRVTVGF